MTETTCVDKPIVVEGLSKQFRNKKFKTVQALKQVTFSVSAGEVFGFLGPNGAGKSTTIKSLMGLLRPTSGSTQLFGVSSLVDASRLKVGFLPENPSFYSFLNAKEYLQFVGRSFRMGSADIKKKSEEVLDLMSLEHAAKRPIRSYSKGMVQRLGLAQTLLHDPDLYILDEPMSGLDPLGRALVKDIILDLKSRGKTVFFSTHVTADIERVCDRVGIVVSGELLEERNVSDLLREGVDGYHCRVLALDCDLDAKCEVVTVSDDVSEVFVRRNDFDKFAANVLASGGSFDLIEPRRRDIEDFFLSLISRSSEVT